MPEIEASFDQVTLVEQVNKTSEQFLIWQDGSPHAARLAVVLEGTGGKVVSDLNEAAVWMQSHAGKRLMALYTPAPISISQAIADGGTPGAALRTWIEKTEKLLCFNRQYRRYVDIVDARCALQDPDGLAGFLEERALRNIEPDFDVVPAPLFTVIAHALLFGDSRALTLFGELDASTVNATGSDPSFGLDIDALYELHTETTRQKEEEQSDQFRSEVKKMMVRYSELESDYIRARSAEVELKTERERGAVLAQDANTLRAERDVLNKRLEQLRGGLDSYQAQVGGLRDELRLCGQLLEERSQLVETLTQELDGAVKRLDEKDREMAALAAEQERLWQSKSFRITAPLRRLRALLTRG